MILFTAVRAWFAALRIPPAVLAALFALASAVVFVTVVWQGVRALHTVVSEARDAIWLRQINEQRAEAERQADAILEASRQAAQREREAREDVAATRLRVIELEAALEAARAVDGNPVIYPRPLVKELRK